MSKKCKLKANNKKKSKEDLSIYPIKIDDDKSSV